MYRPLLKGSSGTSYVIDTPGEVVINKLGRSATAKRSRSHDQTSNASKRVKSETTTPQRPLSPNRDYPRGASSISVTKLTPATHVEERPAQAREFQV